MLIYVAKRSLEQHMPRFNKGDYVKFEVADRQSGETEWLWLRVDHAEQTGKAQVLPLEFSLNGRHAQFSNRL